MIETVLSFFAVGALGFFLYILLLSVLYTVAVECDKYSLAVVATVVGIVIYHKELWIILHSWQLLGISFLVYVVAGAFWASFRWGRLIKKCITEQRIPQYDGRLEITPTTNKSLLEKELRAKLVPSKFKSQLMGWVVFWPWSVFWNITGDFFNMLYENLTGLWTRQAKKALDKAFGPENVK